MLVLTRQRDEAIVLSGPDMRSITITVVDVRGDKVRLGFHAPENIQIDRLEVHEAKRRNGKRKK